MMASTPRLVVVPTESFEAVAPGRWHMLTKTAQGLRAFAAAWPGEMVVIARDSGSVVRAVGTTLDESQESFSFEAVEHPSRARSRHGAAVTLAMHLPDHRAMMELEPRRLVWLTEFSIGERIRIGGLKLGPMGRMRVELGWRTKAAALRRMIAESGGMQANGYPAWDAYAASSPNPLLYFDHRVAQSEVGRPAGFRREGPLRLAFSGRQTKAKGVIDAVEAAVAAHRAGVDLTLEVFGEGEQERAARSVAAPLGERVHFRGLVPFDAEWVPFVREQVDLMLLPHVQGDPAGTYLEAAALGVPTLGYDNSALSALVSRHGLGWTVAMHDRAALAERIGELARTRDLIAGAGASGIDFVREHSFEREFAARVAHLREVAQV